MAAKLQCEICGGELIGRPGGIFECDSCGMKFDTAWAKAKIQEIQGTVKVEGTVEVQGSVKVEGAANKESLLKRGALALEDSKWDEAKKHFNEALNADAECAEAYLGLALADENLRHEDEIQSIVITSQLHRLQEATPFQKCLRFASGELRARIDVFLEQAEKNARENEARIAECKSRNALVRNVIAMNDYHIIGLNADGTVEAAGHNPYGECNVSKWTDIIAVAAGRNTSIGVKSDGTIVVGGDKIIGINADDWNNIIAVAANYSLVGLKSDGTVVTTDYSIRKTVKEWNNITSIAMHADLLGLREDGTVLLYESSVNRGNPDVSCWTDIIGIASGAGMNLGIKSDGSVVVTKDSHGGLVDYLSASNAISKWNGIVAIQAGLSHVVGLKADGTVVATGRNKNGCCDVNDWQNVVAIAAGTDFTAGLSEDGTILIAGEQFYAISGTSEWKLFNSIHTLAQERQEAAERIAHERKEAAEREERKRREAEERAERLRKERIDRLMAEKDALDTELANLKGIFSGKRRKEIESKLEYIDSELKRLS